MADKDQPVFRDFLGLDRIDDINQVKYLSSEMIPASRISSGFESEGDGETNNTRASSGTSGRFKSNSTPIHVLPPFYSTVPSSSDLGSGTACLHLGCPQQALFRALIYLLYSLWQFHFTLGICFKRSALWASAGIFGLTFSRIFNLKFLFVEYAYFPVVEFHLWLRWV